MSEELLPFLGWCLLINTVILLVWFGLFSLGRKWIYQMHSQWFELSEADFNRVHYQAIAFFKLLVVFFNLVPYLAFRLIS